MHARLLITLVTLLGLIAPAERAVGADFCDLVVMLAPKVLGSAIGRVQRVSPGICTVDAADRKSWLIGRMTPVTQSASMLADNRKLMETFAKHSTSDEPSLGAGAWSTGKRGQRTVAFSFASGSYYMTVEMWRDGGVTNADIARVREFAKALSKQ